MSQARSPRRLRRPAPRNFYRGALDAAEQADLEAAAMTEGLDDEVALLRLLVRRELAERPENLRLVLQGMTLLVRAVAARYRLSPSDQAELEQRIAGAIRSVAETVAREAGDA
jgi:hypothetical protein